MAGPIPSSPADAVGAPGEGLYLALRSLRRAAGMSLDVMAARTAYSKSYLSNVESGRRRLTAQIAEAYDRALGVGGLLTRLLTGDEQMPVGRTAELTVLIRYATELSTGRGHAIWVEGEPGIGKSSLLRAGLVAAGSACRVVWATADEGLTAFPLRVLLEGIGTGAMDADPELSEIRGLLGGAGWVGLGAGDPVLAAAERLITLIERWCAAAPVLLVLDDLQWADEMSLLVWGRLRRLVGQQPLLLAAACRPVPRRPEVLALRRGLTGSDLVLPLGPLPPQEVSVLARRLAGAPIGSALRAAVEQAGGNPLYLRELLDALRREQLVRVVNGQAELTGAAVPGSLAAAIGTRLGFLSDATRTVLRTAALLGPTPDVESLAAVTGRAPSELAGILDEAIAAGVLVRGTPRLAFRHGLIRSALYEEIPPALRVALHRQAARAMAEAGTGVEAVAEHLIASGHELPRGDRWMVNWLAAGAAAELLARAPRAALELLERVPSADRAALDGYRISALSLLGRDEEVIRAAPAVLDAGADGESTGRTAWTLAYSLGRVGRREEARRVLAETLRERRLDGVWRARLYACDALLSFDQGVARRAVAEVEATGDRFATGYALHAQAVAYHHGEPDEAAALACIERALNVIGQGPETLDLRALLLANRVIGLSNLGRTVEVPRAMGAALDAAERAGTVPRLVFARTVAADLYYAHGRWDDALAALALLGELADPDPETAWRQRGVAALIAVHRGDRTALREHLAALPPPGAATGSVPERSARLRLAAALDLEAAGRADEALDAILVACLRDGSTPMTPDLVHECQPDIAEIVRLALAGGRRAEAEAFTRTAVAHAQTDVRAGSAAVAQHCRGLLGADPELIAAAVDGYSRAGLVLYRAQAQENQAVLLAARGDRNGARMTYEAAIQTYLHLGAAWDLRRAQSRVDRLGVPGTGYRLARRPSTGWAALTPTERTVATVVANGLSNPEIATRLGISRHTVATHVAHILTKLGGRSRADIARLRPRRPDDPLASD